MLSKDQDSNGVPYNDSRRVCVGRLYLSGTQFYAMLCWAGSYEEEEDREGSNADRPDDLDEEEEEEEDEEIYEQDQWDRLSGKLEKIAVVTTSIL